MKIEWTIQLGLLIAMGLAGCASTNAASDAPALNGSAWVLASLPGQTLVPAATPTARFEEGQVAGSDGCNRYSMPFTTRGSTIEIGPLGWSTRMACPDDITAQAKVFNEALLSARSFRKADGKLELLDTNGSIVATFVAQAQSLAGTSWSVVNINNGRQAVVGIVSDAVLTMEFDTAGQVSGSTGCNRFTATYRADGDTLKITTVAATRRACPDEALAEQEQAFLRALESVATMSFEGNRLDLRQADGALAIIVVRER